MNDKPKSRPRPAQTPRPATEPRPVTEALQQSLDRRW